MSILTNLFDISSLPVDELKEYPVWLIIYVCQVNLPMIGLVVIALKIELKFGKEVSKKRNFGGLIVDVVEYEGNCSIM